MQAVILVGGEGTRLRPLTSTVPKPVVPLVDRPFISFMLEWLQGHGIDDVIMSCGFLATSVRNVLGDGSGLGIRLRFVEEPDPRGTAGALKLAEPMLDDFGRCFADVTRGETIYELADYIAGKGAKETIGMNIGGSAELDDVTRLDDPAPQLGGVHAHARRALARARGHRASPGRGRA